MQELTMDQLKEILNSPLIKGTPEQIRLLAIRVSELRHLNGREWVADNAEQLLDQWERARSRMVTERKK